MRWTPFSVGRRYDVALRRDQPVDDFRTKPVVSVDEEKRSLTRFPKLAGEFGPDAVEPRSPLHAKGVAATAYERLHRRGHGLRPKHTVYWKGDEHSPTVNYLLLE